MADQIADNFLDSYFKTIQAGQQQKQFQAELAFKQSQAQQQNALEERRLTSQQDYQKGMLGQNQKELESQVQARTSAQRLQEVLARGKGISEGVMAPVQSENVGPMSALPQPMQAALQASQRSGMDVAPLAVSPNKQAYPLAGQMVRDVPQAERLQNEFALKQGFQKQAEDAQSKQFDDMISSIEKTTGKPIDPQRKQLLQLSRALTVGGMDSDSTLKILYPTSDPNYHWTDNDNGDVTRITTDASGKTTTTTFPGLGKKYHAPKGAEFLTPASLDGMVGQMQANPDIYHEWSPDVRMAVGPLWTAKTGLPPPAKTDTKLEGLSRVALEHATRIQQLLQDPEIKGSFGPIVGRLGTAEQNVGDTFTKEPGSKKEKEQELRTRFSYLTAQEAKALMGGRSSKQFYDELKSVSANPKFAEEFMTGALKGVVGAAQNQIQGVENQRFGGKGRNLFPQQQAPQANTPPTNRPPLSSFGR